MDHQHYNPDRFTRKSLRLATRDYTAAGAYFVTIRALPSTSLFTIPKLRYILLENWHALPARFPHVTLDEFVIMPDHIHFILWLNGTKTAALGDVVGAYKSLTTVQWIQHLKSVGKDMHYPCRIWQSGYNDRIIRIGALQRIRHYIRNNPNKLQTSSPPDEQNRP